MHSDRVTIEIRDEGGGFHEDDVDCPECQTMPELKLSDGGMGISIIRAVVDDFDLRKPDGGGTVLVLTKMLDSLTAPRRLTPQASGLRRAVAQRPASGSDAGHGTPGHHAGFLGRAPADSPRRAKGGH